MNKVVQEIKQRHPEFQIDIVCFDNRGATHATFKVAQREYIEKALQQIISEYEKFYEVLKCKKDYANDLLLQFMTKLIELPKIMTGDINGPVCFHPAGPITQKKEETMGDDIKIFSGGDTSFAKDHGTSTIYKFTNQPAENLYKEIEKAIQQADANDTDKEDAQDNLKKIGKELEKPKPDKSRLTRLWDGIVAAIPQIAVKLPWDEMIKKVLP